MSGAGWFRTIDMPSAYHQVYVAPEDMDKTAFTCPVPVHSSNGFTPNRLFLGRENRLPVDLAMGLPVNEVNGTRTVDDYVERQQHIAEETFQLVRENLSQSSANVVVY